MADAKIVTLMNRSKRHYDVIGADGKPTRHSPGFTQEYTLEQAAQFDPREMVDLSKIPGGVDKEALRKENAALKAEAEALKKQLAALSPASVSAEAPAADAPAADAEAAPEGEAAEGGRRKKK